MSINLNVYSNGNSTSKSISVDFSCELLASSYAPLDNEMKYFIKITTTAKDENGISYPNKILQGFDANNLALNGTKQAQTNTASAYTSVKALIDDHVYDMINGHAADKFSSGVSYKAPMDF